MDFLSFHLEPFHVPVYHLHLVFISLWLFSPLWQPLRLPWFLIILTNIGCTDQLHHRSFCNWNLGDFLELYDYPEWWIMERNIKKVKCHQCHILSKVYVANMTPLWMVNMITWLRYCLSGLSPGKLLSSFHTKLFRKEVTMYSTPLRSYILFLFESRVKFVWMKNMSLFPTYLVIYLHQYTLRYIFTFTDCVTIQL